MANPNQAGGSPRPAAFRGHPVDAEGRCVHWHGAADVVAFRFACCDGWWPCATCHDEAGHARKPWPAARFGEPSVLCGACGVALTAPAYAASDSRCTACGHAFNPRCRPHWPLYFEGPGPGAGSRAADAK